jgi:hypothetical protein
MNRRWATYARVRSRFGASFATIARRFTTPSGSVLDAGLIACAQAVEHYEMARYGTLCAWAEQLDLDHAGELLNETLDEEQAADQKLSEIAEDVNPRRRRKTRMGRTARARKSPRRPPPKSLDRRRM